MAHVHPGTISMRPAFVSLLGLLLLGLLVAGCSRPVPAPPRADVAAAATTTATSVPRPTGNALPLPIPAWSDAMASVAAGSNRFAIDLFKRLRTDHQNLFFSPFSIFTALSMTATGARGETLDQLVKVLHLPVDGEARPAAGDLGRFYAASDRPFTLATANALWGQSGLAWDDSFRAALAERFGAGFEEADFQGRPDEERQRINAWVAARTEGRIGTLLPPGAVSELTRLCLASAIFFKGDWAEPFDVAATSPQPFRRADGVTAEVPLMHRRGRYDHARLDGGQLVAIPYRGQDLEMVVLLPEAAEGLTAIEDRLTAEALLAWRRGAERVEVDLWLPRFRLDHGFDPVSHLEALGITDLFKVGTADLSGMTTTERLSVSRVLHKAFVIIDEEGTEAAAATAVIANAPAPPPPKPVEFRADRPFLFLIRDAHHDTILFLGRFTGP
jgi:serpin B